MNAKEKAAILEWLEERKSQAEDRKREATTDTDHWYYRGYVSALWLVYDRLMEEGENP